jgi:hypothetical protein
MGLLRAVRQVGEQQPSSADITAVAPMAIHPLPGARVSLLVCDTCDSVMAADGGTAPKPHAASDPSDLAPHYADLGELRATAKSHGWEGEGDRWSCPRCSKPPGGSAT